MLDVRPLVYVAPIDEQEIGPIIPVITLGSYADEDSTITGLFRIYRDSTGLLEYSSVLHPGPLAHGTTADFSAETAFNPGAIADDDYFVICQVVARSSSTGLLQTSQLGPFYFDTKAPPMGPVPAGHHTTHETGGMDEVDCTGLVGAGGVPAAHAATHELGGGDDINVAGLSGELADDQPPKAHDNAAHSVTFEDQANKGVAGGYCGLPNPLITTIPLRADGTPARPDGSFAETDALYYSTGACPPWIATAINSGTLASVAGTAQHPGIISFSSSTSTNSGHYARIGSTNGILLSGSEKSDLILRPKTLSGTTIRFGFHDSVSVTAPVDGVYIYMDPATGIITGRTMSNSASSVTGTGYQLVTNTWYRLRIATNVDASRVDFYCYDEAGAELWTDNITTNIPTAAGREVGHGIVATNSGTTAVALCDIDYLSIEFARVLVR